MERLLYPINDAAEVLGVGRTMLYTLAKQGEVRIVKIGRRTLITAESLDAYIERLTAREAS
jgi:excisionase family DNA binding protein